MGMENAPAELYQEFMQDISAEIDLEGKIIDDLLTLVKMDKSSPDLNIAQTSINGLLEQILKRLTPIAKRRNIEITYESKREVSADVDEVKLSLADMSPRTVFTYASIACSVVCSGCCTSSPSTDRIISSPSTSGME